MSIALYGVAPLKSIVCFFYVYVQWILLFVYGVQGFFRLDCF